MKVENITKHSVENFEVQNQSYGILTEHEPGNTYEKQYLF